MLIGQQLVRYVDIEYGTVMRHSDTIDVELVVSFAYLILKDRLTCQLLNVLFNI